MTTDQIAFPEFPKIPRLNREVIVTEKIDGTNALVSIGKDGIIRAGSRSRWITPEADNFGFAAWVRDHADELRGLGPGLHYGEWWGAGIQRRYGLDHKRFSLFNTSRWSDDAVRPACCHVVPVLATGTDIREAVEEALAKLRKRGSYAAPEFARPEGVVAFHTASSTMFKVTLERDEEPKGRLA
jgi:hypothetical protein